MPSKEEQPLYDIEERGIEIIEVPAPEKKKPKIHQGEEGYYENNKGLKWGTALARKKRLDNPKSAYDILNRTEAGAIMSDTSTAIAILETTPEQQEIINKYAPAYVLPKKRSKGFPSFHTKPMKMDELIKLTKEQVETYFPDLIKKWSLFNNLNDIITKDEMRINMDQARYIQLKALWSALSREYDVSGITKLEKFYENTLDLAIEDPNSRAGAMIGVMVYDKDNIKELTNFAKQQVSMDLEFKEFQIRKRLFKEQADFVFDDVRYKIACMARSTGKTEAMAAMIACASLYPGDIIYINESALKAVAQIKDVMLKYCSIINNNPDKITDPITWPSGARFFTFGGGNVLSPEKLRGYNKCRLIIWDESSLQPYLRDSLSIALPNISYYSGRLVFIGNPPKVPGTLFEELWNKSEEKNDLPLRFKRYYWERKHNPFIPDPLADEESFIQIYGDGPRFKREMKGIMGSYDIEARVFPKLSYITNQTPTFDRTTIGLDYGGTGKCAIISLAWNSLSKKAEVIYEYLNVVPSATDLINLIKEAYNKAKQKTSGVVQIKTDTDNQLITNDLRTHHNIPAYKCSKMKIDKQWTLEKISELLSSGMIQIPKNGKLEWEAERTIWRRDEETGIIIHEIDDKNGLHPDAIMALEYAAIDYFQDCGFISPVDEEFKERPTRLESKQIKKEFDEPPDLWIPTAAGTVIKEKEYKI